VLRIDLSAFVDRVHLAVEAPLDSLSPGDVAVAFDDGVAVTEVECLVRVERGVYAAIDDEGAPCAGDPADFVSPQGIAGVDPDADDVSLRDGRRIEALESFVSDVRVTVPGRGGCRQNIEPTGGDNRHAERDVGGID